jgi:hypothetical protein
MNRRMLTAGLVAVLILSVFLNLYLFIQNQNGLRAESRISQEVNFYNEFGTVPASNFAYPFSPPISMYQALQIGLESEGWNKTSLAGIVVSADFVYAWTGGDIFTPTKPGPSSGVENLVTSPPANYPHVPKPLGLEFEYAWEITVNNPAKPSNQLLGFSLVDAQTGSLLPNPVSP